MRNAQDLPLDAEWTLFLASADLLQSIQEAVDSLAEESPELAAGEKCPALTLSQLKDSKGGLIGSVSISQLNIKEPAYAVWWH